MNDLQESAVGVDEVRRLRKQLAKVKALYREAQSQLETRQTSSVSKTQLNNLKAQVKTYLNTLGFIEFWWKVIAKITFRPTFLISQSLDFCICLADCSPPH